MTILTVLSDLMYLRTLAHDLIRLDHFEWLSLFFAIICRNVAHRSVLKNEHILTGKSDGMKFNVQKQVHNTINHCYGEK